jgi:hypothetical protein
MNYEYYDTRFGGNDDECHHLANATLVGWDATSEVWRCLDCGHVEQFDTKEAA